MVGGLTYDRLVIECVGPAFIQYFNQSLKESHNCQDRLSVSSEDADNDEETTIVDFEDDIDYLKSLDPKKWKAQDHYAVLGLKTARYKATAGDIKSAYRQMVLKHHPDKRKAKGEVVNRDNDYFTCITKAWEILGDTSKRRSYDSVDPEFDDDIPTSSEGAKGDFFKVFTEFFEMNSRWSEKQPVPALGGPDDSREKVNHFYSFWYDFESWREYSYEDEETKESGQDRDERKWIEKQNKVVRAKKKKEEMSRIRSLVDLAYSLDPRIAKFKQEDKEKKEAQKRAKAEAARARQEEINKAQREEEERIKKEKEQEEAERKAKQSALKAEREAQKKALRKEKKSLRDFCKANNYFVEDPKDLVKHTEFMEKMCEMLNVKELEQFNEQLKAGGRQVFIDKVKKVEEDLESERQKIMNLANSKQNSNGSDSSCNQAAWNPSTISLLIKAVNLFPAGTSQRWEVVANFINQHSKGNSISVRAKDVLSKAKELQTNDDFNVQLKQAANEKAYDHFEKQKKVASVEVTETSQRFESVAEQQGISLPWTSEEQQSLEQALKSFPASTADRWDRIAESIPSRTKKECMKRYKELVEMVKAKKAAEMSLKGK